MVWGAKFLALLAPSPPPLPPTSLMSGSELGGENGEGGIFDSGRSVRVGHNLSVPHPCKRPWPAAPNTCDDNDVLADFAEFLGFLSKHLIGEFHKNLRIYCLL